MVLVRSNIHDYDVASRHLRGILSTSLGILHECGIFSDIYKDSECRMQMYEYLQGYIVAGGRYNPSPGQLAKLITLCINAGTSARPREFREPDLDGDYLRHTD
ncbi:hypothetical protein N7495_006287 [Penicillium taxi]|uniref:uncharacterized protein n=1 Tax=Penicillium taxi TaxID=168475 RepID=UPI0025454C3D|nr:uncharacterized protein N7495_006287 [Penicillium taxi]KAJ5894596.1 hypothetical protein N7495_006287 [Penicillium taxi]